MPFVFRLPDIGEGLDEAEIVDDAEHERLTALADTEGITPTFTP